MNDAISRDAFLFGIYRLTEESKDNPSLKDDIGDAIFDTIDRLLCDGKFSECDDLIASLDVNRIDTSAMRSFLVITSAAKSKLPSRRLLYSRIYDRMIEVKGEEKTKRTLKNLE
jgi:hypothetical protein